LSDSNEIVYTNNNDKLLNIIIEKYRQDNKLGDLDKYEIMPRMVSDEIFVSNYEVYIKYNDTNVEKMKLMIYIAKAYNITESKRKSGDIKYISNKRRKL
jgi:hypothetical protein